MVDVFTNHMPASDVFAIEPHFDGTGDAVEFKSKVVRGAGVIGVIDDDVPMDRRAITQVFRLLSSEAQKEFFDRVQELWYGGLSCYVPTYANDFDVVGVTSSTLTVKHNGFDTIYNQICSYRVDRPWLYTCYGLLVITNDGKRHFFKLGLSSHTTPGTTGPAEINAYVNNGNGTGTLNLKLSGLETGLQGYSASQIRLCSLIVRARLTTPSMELNTLSTAIVETSLSWTEVFFESPFLDATQVEGWYIPILDNWQQPIGYWKMSVGNKMKVNNNYVLLSGGAPPVGKMAVVSGGVTYAVTLTGE